MDQAEAEVIDIPLPAVDAECSDSEMPIEVEELSNSGGHFSVDYRRC